MIILALLEILTSTIWCLFTGCQKSLLKPKHILRDFLPRFHLELCRFPRIGNSYHRRFLDNAWCKMMNQTHGSLTIFATQPAWSIQELKFGFIFEHNNPLWGHQNAHCLNTEISFCYYTTIRRNYQKSVKLKRFLNRNSSLNSLEE